MERRTLLKGLFGGVVAGGVIIKATDNDVMAFANPLQQNQPVILGTDSTHPMPGDMLFNAKGEPVAEIQFIMGRSRDPKYDKFRQPTDEIQLHVVAIGDAWKKF